jgi:hypothetical protein
MTSAVLVGDNREVGRGLGTTRTVNESAMLVGLGLGTKAGVGHLGELVAVNRRAYINHTTPFSAAERPDLGEAVKLGQAPCPELVAGAFLSTYVFYVPVGSQPDEGLVVQDAAVSTVYSEFLAKRQGAQYAVVTVGEFEDAHWHAFHRPPIYHESGSNRDGTLKPEYLAEGRWTNVFGIAVGFLQRRHVRPGEHKILFTGQDHTHFLRLQDSPSLERFPGQGTIDSAASWIFLEEIFQALQAHPDPPNPVHLYAQSRLRRAVLISFNLTEIFENGISASS